MHTDRWTHMGLSMPASIVLTGSAATIPLLRLLHQSMSPFGMM